MNMLIEWYWLRFGNPDNDPSYFEEWVRRYNRGLDYFWAFCDSDSRSKFINVLANHITDRGIEVKP